MTLLWLNGCQRTKVVFSTICPADRSIPAAEESCPQGSFANRSVSGDSQPAGCPEGGRQPGKMDLKVRRSEGFMWATFRHEFVDVMPWRPGRMGVGGAVSVSP